MDRKLMISLLVIIVAIIASAVLTTTLNLDISLTVVSLMLATLGVFYWMQDDLTFFG